MSQKADSNNPSENHKPEQDGQNEEEFVEFTEKIFKNPTIINTFPSEQFDTPTTPKMQKRNSLFFKKKSTRDEKYEARLLEEVKVEKKVFLKNYSKEVVKDAKAREDYLVLFAFVSLSGNNIPLFNELRDRSTYLSGLHYDVTPKELLDLREFISQVLIAAANQKEDTVIKEIIKNESFGYIVSLQIVLAFVKNDLHGLLKPLLKVADTNHKSSLKVLSNFIQQNSPKRRMQKKESNNSDSSHPLQLRRTLVNMANMAKSAPADDYSAVKKPLFNHSAFSDGESLIKEGQGNTNKSLKSMTSGENNKLEKQPVQEKEFFVSRAPPAKSAYNNVTIECKFENILPYMIQYEKLDVIDIVIDAFGENKVNHLSLLILHTQEAAALKYYKKKTWDLTENQAIMLCNKKMWNFLCNIDDELDRNIFFVDNVFANMKEMSTNGKVLTELVVFFMTLPLNSWRQNQAVALMELASGLLKDDPDINRLVYANNPILTCAQLSFLLEKLASNFRFIQNDLLALSVKMRNLAYNLQNSYRENNLYSLYLKALPTGLTMLDYILQMGMKNLVETKFTKGLVLELWDNDSLVTGSKKEISIIHNSVHLSKKFMWKPKITSKLTENYSFEFGNMTTSAKYLLYLDLAYLAFLYIILDIYIYTKVEFFSAMQSEPEEVYNLKPYYLDLNYHEHPNRTIFTIIVFFNYWFFFLIRTIYIYRQSIGSKSHKVGYLLTFAFVTLTLISLGMFPSYESQIRYQTLLKLILVFTRTAVAYLFGNSMLGFQKSGQTITIVATVTTSMIMILVMLLAYMLFVGEIMNNFFRMLYLFGQVPESFFSLVEILFGSITFLNTTDVGIVGNETVYYTSNFFVLIYSFTSTILGTFLLIAYLSSTYEATRNEASYLNTLTQYYYIQIFTRTEWKGFYAFPPMFMPFVIPFMFLHRIQKFKEPVNILLLKIRFFMIWVTFQILKYIFVNLFYYAPVLYVKNLLLLSQGKTLTKGSNILHFIGWLFGGPFMIGYYMVNDIKILLKVLCKDFSIILPREKLLLRVTDDDVIYFQRYESLKEGFVNIMKENPEIQQIFYFELLNYLMNGWKVTNNDIPKSVLIKKETVKQRLPDLIRKHQKRLGGSKWLKSIYDAKKRFYKELLDGFLNYKTRSMRPEDSTIDPKVALDILQEVTEDNIVYLRARQIFAIQFVLLNTQSKENISTMNKIDELDKKIDKLFKIYFAQHGQPQDFKWSRIIRSTTDVGFGGGIGQGHTMNNVEHGGEKPTTTNKALVFGTAVT